jgi:hypothetical protein
MIEPCSVATPPITLPPLLASAAAVRSEDVPQGLMRCFVSAVLCDRDFPKPLDDEAGPERWRPAGGIDDAPLQPRQSS